MLSEARKDIQRLRRELDDTKKTMARSSTSNGQTQHSAVSDPKPHPAAREGPPRDGDWACAICGFGTNRWAREHCFKCAAPKIASFQTAAGAAGTLGGVGTQPLAAAPPSPAGASGTAAAITSTTTQTTTGALSYAQVAVGQQQAAPAAAGPHAAAGGGPPHPVSPAAPAPTGGGPEQVKLLKDKVELLVAARTSLAANPHCAEALAGIDAQIMRARAQLSEALPLEVALRGTLGAVAQARNAVQRAEARTQKAEQQVATAVEAYETAAAELQVCRRQLAEAEAATARTAGGHLDPRSFFGDHPGAAWAALQAAAAAVRCVPGTTGLTPELVARVEAAFREMQSVCSLLGAEPPLVQQHPQPQGARQEPHPQRPATDATGAMAGVAQQQPAGQQGGEDAAGGALLQPSSAAVPSLFEATVAAAATAAGSGGGAPLAPNPPASGGPAAGGGAPTPPPPHPQSAGEPGELVPPLNVDASQALQASMLAAQHEAAQQAALQAAAAQQVAAAAAAATAAAQNLPPVPSDSPTASPAALGAGPVAPAVGNAAGANAHAGGGAAVASGAAGGAAPADASMGADAADAIAGKRNHSAVEAGRAIAAKAKARAA